MGALARSVHKLWLTSLVAASVLATESAAQDDFLATSRDPYALYAIDRYVRYSDGFAGRRAMYDRLGQFTSFGTFGIRWNETRDRYTQEKIDGGIGLNELNSQSDILFQERLFSATFRYLTIARQNYGDQYMAFTVGRNISTTFTPLVLNQLQYAGLRVEYHTRRHDTTFLLTRGGRLGSPQFSDFAGDIQGTQDLSPVILYGANWVGRFGALRVGSTFLRQVQSNVKSGSSSLWDGDVPYPELRSPRQITVRVSDDSPRDKDGAAVVDADIFVRGRRDGVESGYTSASDRAGVSMIYDVGLEPVITGSGGRRVAEGADEYIDIVFDLSGLPTGVVGQQAEIEVVVDGDYRIAVRQLHDFQTATGDIESRSWPSPPPISGIANVYFKDRPYEEEPFYTVRRSDGSPARDGEVEIVRFNHAIPTAQTFYGANLRLDTERLSVKGEWVLNDQDFMFPTAQGGRHDETAAAGYLTVLGRLGAGGNIGAEVFRIDPTYGGWYDSKRGGLILFTDVAGNVFTGEHLGNDPLTQEFKLYDDNDDHDSWPDDRPFSGDGLYVPQGAYQRPLYPAGLPEGGVYPGLDMDGDHILDFDRNRNAVADWFEPFLGFASDPPEFVYGIDFNNNLVPDFRENDDEPDYPYRRDQEGVHLFYDYTRLPWWLSTTRVGWFHTTEVVGGHRSRGVYARLAGALEAPTFWAEYKDDLKRVRDDIPDDVFRLVLTTDIGESIRLNEPARLPFPDFLPMRNSLANTAYLNTGWLPLPGLKIGNSFKYVLNRQLEDEDDGGALIQEDNARHNFSMINKVSYERQVLPQLTLTGRVKHLLAAWDEASFTPIDSVAVGQETSWSLLTPEVLAIYRLTRKTRIEFGQHGLFIPALKARFDDREDDDNGYTANTSVLQLAIKGEYGGYNMLSHVGIRREREDPKAPGAEDTELTAFYVDLVFGVE